MLARHEPDPRVRERFAREMSKLRSGYNASLWAMERQLHEVSETVSARIRALRAEVEKEFGFTARFSARSLGPILLWTIKREERRLARGQTYEPPTFCERTNWVPA